MRWLWSFVVVLGVLWGAGDCFGGDPGDGDEFFLHRTQSECSLGVIGVEIGVCEQSASDLGRFEGIDCTSVSAVYQIRDSRVFGDPGDGNEYFVPVLVFYIVNSF